MLSEAITGADQVHRPWGKPIASACSRLLPYFVQLALQEAALVSFRPVCPVRKLCSKS